MVREFGTQENHQMVKESLNILLLGFSPLPNSPKNKKQRGYCSAQKKTRWFLVSKILGVFIPTFISTWFPNPNWLLRFFVTNGLVEKAMNILSGETFLKQTHVQLNVSGKYTIPMDPMGFEQTWNHSNIFQLWLILGGDFSRDLW